MVFVLLIYLILLFLSVLSLNLTHSLFLHKKINIGFTLSKKLVFFL